MMFMVDTGISRRQALRIALASTGATTLGGLAGCMGGGGNGGDSSNGTSGTADINYWHKEPGQEELMNEIVDGFSGAKIEPRAISEDDMPSQLQSAQASGTLPTVLEAKVQTIQQMGSGSALSTGPVEEVISDIGEDDFFKGALDVLSSPEGDRYAVPYYAWIQIFAYRDSKFEEHGLEAPTDWDKLRTAAETLHDPDNDQYGIGLGDKEHFFTRECFQPFALSNGARVFNTDGEIIFDSSEMVEALEFYAELENNYGIPGRNHYGPLRQMYLNENVHLTTYSSWLLTSILTEGSQEMLEDTSVVAHVENKRRATYGMVNGLTIFKDQSPEEVRTAKEFIKYMVSGDPYVQFLHNYPAGPNPSRKSVSESDSYRNCEFCSEDVQGVMTVAEDDVARIAEGAKNIERFGIVEGNSFPEFGDIASELLVAKAVSRTIRGEDAETVASDIADQMRDVIS